MESLMSPSEQHQQKQKESNEEATINNQLPQFDRSLPMMLKRARESVMAKFMPALKEHDLSAEQWRAMRLLDLEKGLTISELSKRCYVLKPSMTRIIQNLENRQIIERRAIESDQRLISIFLTQTGYDLISTIAPLTEKNYQRIEQQFGNEKLNQLTALLDELIIATDNIQTSEDVLKAKEAKE